MPAMWPMAHHESEGVVHPHFCECEDCLNRGGGVRLSSFRPNPNLPSQRARLQKRLAQQRFWAKRKLREAARG